MMQNLYPRMASEGGGTSSSWCDDKEFGNLMEAIVNTKEIKPRWQQLYEEANEKEAKLNAIRQDKMEKE
jgi:hypothetical protein